MLLCMNGSFTDGLGDRSGVVKENKSFLEFQEEKSYKNLAFY